MYERVKFQIITMIRMTISWAVCNSNTAENREHSRTPLRTQNSTPECCIVASYSECAALCQKSALCFLVHRHLLVLRGNLFIAFAYMDLFFLQSRAVPHSPLSTPCPTQCQECEKFCVLSERMEHG